MTAMLFSIFGLSGGSTKKAKGGLITLSPLKIYNIKNLILQTAMQCGVCCVYIIKYALILDGSSMHKPYCSKQHLENQEHMQLRPPVQ